MPDPMKLPLSKLYTPQNWSGMEGTGEAVSVIMRTRSRGLLLPRALQSVLGQSFKDWKLYLVNDGGDKSTLEASLAPFRARFGDRLFVIHHEEARGMEAASNAGLAAAQGEFFAIHDDDDRWHEDFLSQTVAYLMDPAHRAYAGVATGCDVVQERIENGAVIMVAQFPWIYFQPPVEFGAILARNQMPPITLLLRRALLARIGDYNEALPVLGDWEFILRVLTVGDLGAIEAPLAYYHHRVAAGQSVYANSVSAGLNIHREMKAALGNQIVRKALEEEPALLGVLWPVLQAVEQCRTALEANKTVQEDILQRLVNIETHMRVVPQLTVPLRWLKRRLQGLKVRLSQKR
jgi:hypothetical protein